MVREEFEGVICDLTGFYRIQLDQTQTHIWYRIFQKYDKNTFKLAVDWHLEHDTFNSMPPPGKITYAIDRVEEEKRDVPNEYPEWTHLWSMVIKFFPGQHLYKYFPPEDDVNAWRRIYDEVVRQPHSKRQRALETTMARLEREYVSEKK